MKMWIGKTAFGLLMKLIVGSDSTGLNVVFPIHIFISIIMHYCSYGFAYSYCITSLFVIVKVVES